MPNLENYIPIDNNKTFVIINIDYDLYDYGNKIFLDLMINLFPKAK